jgi:hypothetical protein
MVPAALRIHPHDGILWAMFLRLLFGPESHQDLRHLRASCEDERKGREEQSRREPRSIGNDPLTQAFAALKN